MTMLLRLNRIYRSRKLQASNFMAKLQESLPQDFFGSDSDGQDISHGVYPELISRRVEMTDHLKCHFERRARNLSLI
jgi:hypothetical protein